METLSNEVVLHILSFCDVKELCAFAKTSSLSLLLAEDEKLWEQRCKLRGYPKKTVEMSWKKWYAKLSHSYLVNCQWYYGDMRSAHLYIGKGAKLSVIKKVLCKVFDYYRPEKVVINGCSNDDDDEEIPQNILETGLLVSWVR